jgi:hypothetical protein
MQVEIAGTPTRFQAGDWVEVGKQLALRWIAEGSAEAPQSTLTHVAGDGSCGILVTGNDAAAKQVLADSADKIAIAFDLPKLRWNKTLIWSGDCPLRFELILIGFGLLDKWDVLYPFCDYHKLADGIGSEEDRERTKKIVRDLRIPVPDIRLIYMKRNGRTEELMDVWREESVGSSEESLAFLRAVYRVKPFQLPLPTTWTGRGPR